MGAFEVFVESMIEKFTIEMTENGLTISGRDGNRLVFSAGEALMLLDMLKNEEESLNKMAEEASPIPVKIKYNL